MHMADALISPAVGGAMWAATAGLTVYSARKLKENPDDQRAPLMGVLGAFIFAAQMINFTIPGTGSSGHLGGGMILAIMLGPHAAFLTMASILTVQALFFADGGLLALGCNIFNLGFFPCFIAYPLIYQKIAGKKSSSGRILGAAMAACILGLQLGALGVILETWSSGVSELTLTTFTLLMLPIHLAIGVVEGAVTAAVTTFVRQARPDILDMHAASEPTRLFSLKYVLGALLLTAILTSGFFSWFASTHPDGLEWSIKGVTGKEELDSPKVGAHGFSAWLQERLALLPDYDFKKSEEKGETKAESWPEINPGKSLAGVIGIGMTLLLTGILGVGLRRFARPGKG